MTTSHLQEQVCAPLLSVLSGPSPLATSEVRNQESCTPNSAHSCPMPPGPSRYCWLPDTLFYV